MSNFASRFEKYKNEFEWLYMELYNNRASLDKLIDEMETMYTKRSEELKALDTLREQNPNWYKGSDMLGITLYTDLFADDLNGLIEKIPYLKELGIKYLHLMPLLKMPHPQNDGGYAVEDFGTVDPKFGTNEDLLKLTEKLREAGISLCLDFVMNHTASSHEWAVKARQGDPYYMNYYHNFEDYNIPRWYEQTMPQVFPATAPGNFTYCDDMQRWVMTTFYPFQWDLNYWNPEVFREMSMAMLNLCNMGVEVLRIDAVPYIWKELGTSCRNHPKVHTIVRLVRIMMDCICPSSIIKGEVVMAPHELAPYFGTPEQPGCHLLYNVSSMVNLWSSLASQDVRLLKEQLNTINALPKHCSFVNYLRCHDDIGWGLDEADERRFGIDPLQHKIFLYRFYEGKFPGSYARGMLYNYDPVTLDARTCGTCASLCGIEAAQNDNDLELAIKRMLLMHAAMMSIKGLPMLNSGDEIAQLNDWSFLEDPDRRDDSRNIHRSKFDWGMVRFKDRSYTLQYKIWKNLKKLKELRSANPCFNGEADVTTWDTRNDRVLALIREFEGKKLICLFNFHYEPQGAYLPLISGNYEDAFTNTAYQVENGIMLKPYQYMWLIEK